MEASMQAGASGARTQDLIATVSAISNSLMNEVSKVIIGKNENLRRVTVGILSNGNMLLEDFPGLAKTLLANTFARALGCKFKRVQFTPDLLPSDIMGTYMYDQKSGEFKLRAGPLFSNILLADEINRAPPKTQAALLEAMMSGGAQAEEIRACVSHVETRKNELPPLGFRGQRSKNIGAMHGMCNVYMRDSPPATRWSSSKSPSRPPL